MKYRMKMLGGLAAAFALFGMAQAAPITVVNGDFEAASPLTKSGVGYGSWGFSAVGWTTSGAVGGTMAPDYGSLYYEAPPGDQIGWINAKGTIFQDLGVSIEADTDYTLSALIGDRLDQKLGGYFGFFAGDISNVIGSAALVSSNGLWTLNEFTMLASDLSSYVGLSLGIFFSSTLGQVNIAWAGVDAKTLFEDKNVALSPLLEDPNLIVNPIPAAAWLFGTALFGGGFLARRRKAA